MAQWYDFERRTIVHVMQFIGSRFTTEYRTSKFKSLEVPSSLVARGRSYFAIIYIVLIEQFIPHPAQSLSQHRVGTHFTLASIPTGPSSILVKEPLGLRILSFTFRTSLHKSSGAPNGQNSFHKSKQKYRSPHETERPQKCQCACGDDCPGHLDLHGYPTRS